MANDKKLLSNRPFVQFFSLFFFNSYYHGFTDGTIYRGSLKNVCIPVLNCYSCPGAIGSCPVGSLQSVASGLTYNFSFYVAGLLGLSGIFFGRLACGWICPFGLIQDLLFRIPSPKLTLPGWMRYIKHAVLLLPVLLLPPLLTDSFGLGSPYFCKWMCPAGTLEAAIPLYIVYPPVRPGAGLLFSWRIIWLLLIIIFIILIKRGFCQAFCPLGSIYSFFNKFSYYSLSIDTSRCTSCHLCSRTCFARINVRENPNHPECTRCLECVKKCPSGAIQWNFLGLSSPHKGGTRFCD